MDALYIYKYSPFDDFEIRYSLRSLAEHAPWIKKVWVFGDCPSFITNNKTVIEHIPHFPLASVLGLRVPVVNYFLLIFLASLIPEMDSEFLLMADDIVLLKYFSEKEGQKDRALKNLMITPRMAGLFAESLNRTCDTLFYKHCSTYNFETHVPQRMTKRRVLNAYCEFKDFISQDRFYGVLAPTAILNLALKNEGGKTISLEEENSRCGYWGIPPSKIEVQDKMFFNFDDAAFGNEIKKFLTQRFPEPCKYERI